MKEKTHSKTKENNNKSLIMFFSVGSLLNDEVWVREAAEFWILSVCQVEGVSRLLKRSISKDAPQMIHTNFATSRASLSLSEEN
jgi:hypothetical protein